MPDPIPSSDRDQLGEILSKHITHGNADGGLIHGRAFDAVISDVIAWADKRAMDKITGAKIRDALALTRFTRSSMEGAQDILRSAGITKLEINAVISDPGDRKILHDLLR
jgi:23S rRNA U2552 (ribose-2'-O)-methylase RlmE/FtsJ